MAIFFLPLFSPFAEQGTHAWCMGTAQFQPALGTIGDEEQCYGCRRVMLTPCRAAGLWMGRGGMAARAMGVGEAEQCLGGLWSSQIEKLLAGEGGADAGGRGAGAGAEEG